MKDAALNNPIPELLTDALYAALDDLKLLNYTAVRNHQIRFMFIKLKAKKIRSWKAAGIIQKTYSELTRDTILQIALRKDHYIKTSIKVKEWKE